MFRKITLTALAAATAMTAIPAAADARPNRGYYDDGYYSQNEGGHRYQRGDRYRGYEDRGYGYGYGYSDGYGRRYRGSYYGRNHGYYGDRCRGDGATGTILGALAGGLIGHEIAEGGRYRRGDGTAGTILGGAVGALAGRAIDRDC